MTVTSHDVEFQLNVVCFLCVNTCGTVVLFDISRLQRIDLVKIVSRQTCCTRGMQKFFVSTLSCE